MSIDTDRFINYAAHDIPGTQIAAAFGLSPSKVSQLLADVRVQEKVKTLKGELALRELATQTEIDSINKKLLGRISDLAEETDSLSEAVRAYETMTKMARSKDVEEGKKSQGVRLVQINLPAFLNPDHKIAIELDGNNEIVEIAGRSMATMPALETHKLIQGRGQTNGQRDSREGESKADA